MISIKRKIDEQTTLKRKYINGNNTSIIFIIKNKIKAKELYETQNVFGYKNTYWLFYNEDKDFYYSFYKPTYLEYSIKRIYTKQRAKAYAKRLSNKKIRKNNIKYKGNQSRKEFNYRNWVW